MSGRFLNRAEISVEGFLALGGGGRTEVPDEAGTGGPGLVFFVAEGTGAAAKPVNEGWQAVAVPFLQAGAGGVNAGASPLVGEDSDLVDKVGMERPTRRDHPARVEIPDVLVVEPFDDKIEPLPQFRPQRC